MYIGYHFTLIVYFVFSHWRGRRLFASNRWVWEWFWQVLRLDVFRNSTLIEIQIICGEGLRLAAYTTQALHQRFVIIVPENEKSPK